MEQEHHQNAQADPRDAMPCPILEVLVVRSNDAHVDPEQRQGREEPPLGDDQGQGNRETTEEDLHASAHRPGPPW